MATFLGQLTQNEIYSALYNMIISQEVFDRIDDSDELVDEAKVDGSLYGDTKLYYAADVLSSSAWGNDAEAANLLALKRPAAPSCQAIKLDVFRQIKLTLDEYLSKRAWGDEYAFGQFNSLMEGMIGKTKRIYDVTTYNAFIGTAKGYDSANNEQKVTVTVASNETPEGIAKKIAQAIADLEVDMTKVSRKYNKYGHITKFSKKDLKLIGNSDYVNKITKVMEPSIFHKDGLINFDKVLPADYFGTFNSSEVAAADNDGSYFARVEAVYGTTHVFPGEAIPASVKIPAGAGYQKDATAIGKVFVKLPAFMSAFQVGTSFFNDASLTITRFLTWAHNTLELFDAYPCVTIYLAVDDSAVVGTPVIVANDADNPVVTQEVSE